MVERMKIDGKQYTAIMTRLDAIETKVDTVLSILELPDLIKKGYVKKEDKKE